jgi:hypothetical protein
MRKAIDPDAPTQKFSQIHKEVTEELQAKHPKEDLERAVGPQQYENFHRVVSKMINQSDMTDHDKMIARRKWNRAEQEVAEGHVSHVTLASWEKMLAGTTLFVIDRMDSKSGKVPWRQLNRALSGSAAIRDFTGLEGARVIPEGYDSYEDFEADIDNDNWPNTQSPESHDEGPEDGDNEEGFEEDYDDDDEDGQEEHVVFDSFEDSNVIETTGTDHQVIQESIPAEEFSPEKEGKKKLGQPVSLARRPKSERGAHKAGKPVAEPLAAAESSEPTPVTASMPKVTVGQIPEGEGWLDDLDK